MKKLALLLVMILLLGCCTGCGDRPEDGQNTLGTPTEEQIPQESVTVPYEFDEYIGTEYLCEDGNHQYTSEVIADVTCTEDGQILHICILCGEGYVETVYAAGHYADAATCDFPSTCIDCGATLESALGHTTANGTCTRCGEKIG